MEIRQGERVTVCSHEDARELLITDAFRTRLIFYPYDRVMEAKIDARYDGRLSVK